MAAVLLLYYGISMMDCLLAQNTAPPIPGSAWMWVFQFGVPTALLLIFIGITVQVLRWLAKNAVSPLVESGVEYLKLQTQATQENQESIRRMAEVEKEIRDHMANITKIHVDEDSTFSTVHTNAGLELLAKAVQRIATASEIDIDDLILEMKHVLARQKGSK